MNCYRMGERKKMIADSKQPPPPPESLPTELSNAGVRINMTVTPPPPFFINFAFKDHCPS